MRRIISVSADSAGLFLIYLLFVTVVTGCETKPRSLKSGRQLPPGAMIAVIGPSQIHPNWKGIRGGAQRYADQGGFLDCLTVAPTDEEPAALLNLVDGVITKKPVAICLCVERPDSARPAAKRIIDNGILLVTIGRRIEGVSAFGHVAVGWPEAAEILGRSLTVLLPETVNRFGRKRSERSYILLHEDSRDELTSLCYTRFSVVTRNVPRLALLEESNAAQSDRPPNELIQEMLKHFPSAELIVTLNPDVWLSLQPHYNLPTRTNPNGESEFTTHFASLGAPPRMWPRLRSREAKALVGPLDGEIGYTALELAVEGVMLNPDVLTRRVITCELVTPETLGDFARRYALAANLDVETLTPFGTSLPAASQPGGG